MDENKGRMDENTTEEDKTQILGRVQQR